MDTTKLNCSGLQCPLPILRLAKTMGALPAGSRVELTATDPGALNDVAAWAHQTGNRLIESWNHDPHYVFVLEKGDPIAQSQRA
ncbi:MAG: sulfurtransferase TusA family protein [Acidiferrobacteraceae bacterium]